MSEYALAKPPLWKRGADRVELWDPKRERWATLAPFTAELLAGVEAEEPIAALARRLGPEAGRPGEKAQQRARRFVYNLSRLGYVAIPFPAKDRYHGRYRTLRELGRGGVGVAWLCEDERGGGALVVKRAWDFLQPYAVTEAAMRREADVMARLDHPGVARLAEAFEEDGHVHLAREFLDGEDLMAWQGRGVPHWREVADDIAGILQHLHERGVLLLDLRPSNFIIDARTGRPRLLDVGGCREHRGGDVRFPTRVGSPGFMSPEMDARKVATVASDVWGLGRLVAFLASGALPPKDADAAALAARLPQDAAALVARIAADDPAARPSLAEARGLLAAGKP